GIRDFHVTGVQTCALPIYHDQRQLATERWPGMPHGPARLGKAAAIGIAWLYRRLYADSAHGGAVSIPPPGDWAVTSPEHLLLTRSEERRVGKECSSRWVTA